MLNNFTINHNKSEPRKNRHFFSHSEFVNISDILSELRVDILSFLSQQILVYETAAIAEIMLVKLAKGCRVLDNKHCHADVVVSSPNSAP